MRHTPSQTLNRRPRSTAAAAAAALAIVAGAALAAAPQAHAATGCQVDYTITNQWTGGFGTNINITNLGAPLSSWTLKFSFGGDQKITQIWNGAYTQSGADVTINNVSYNGSLGTNATTNLGFNGTSTTSNPIPSDFTLNGITCNTTTTPSPTPTTNSPSPSPSTNPTPTPTPSPSTSPSTSPTPSPTTTPSGGGNDGKPRIVFMTDIPPINGIPGGEPGPANLKSDLDDSQTLVRFLSYADEFDIEGLIATSGTFANYADKTHIDSFVNAYAQVYPDMSANDPAYPTPAYLNSVTKQGASGTWGAAVGNIIGSGHDSEASNWIISVVDKPDPRPVWFHIGGGSADLAQALWKVQNTRSAADVAKFVSKIRVVISGQQDGSAAWMESTFPKLWVATNTCYGAMTNSVTNGTWLTQNITTGHGALGAAYPPAHWLYSQPGVYEGDSPDFLLVLGGALGMSDPEDPTMGGWGGSWKQTGADRWSCSGSAGVLAANENTDWANRIAWGVETPSQANHNPIAHLDGDGSRSVLHLNAAAGSTVQLSANGSTDPDGNSLTYKWFQYATSAGVTLVNNTSQNASVTLPNTHGTKVEIVLAVTDNGSPNLTSYRRLVINVQ